MYYALRTIAYFLTWGTFYGLLLGLWATTAMFPALGTLMGLVWGPAVGAVCGFMCGILVALIQAFTFHEEANLTRYSRTLSLVIGSLVTVAAPVIVFVTSEGTLWTHSTDWRPYAADFFIPSLLSAAFWGGLSAAYVAHNHPLWLANLKLTRAHEEFWPALKTPFRSAWGIARDTLVTALAAYVPTRWLARIRLHETETTAALTQRWQMPRVTLAMIRTTFRLPFLLTAFYTIVCFVLLNPITESVPDAIFTGTVASFGIALMLIIGNSALLTFIKQLFLNEDDAVSPRYAHLLMTVAAVTFTSMLALYYLILARELWLLLPPWILLMGYATERAVPLFNLASEKTKRKEKTSDKAKNSLMLDEEIEGEEVYESADGAMLQNVQTQAHKQS